MEQKPNPWLMWLVVALVIAVAAGGLRACHQWSEATHYEPTKEDLK